MLMCLCGGLEQRGRLTPSVMLVYVAESGVMWRWVVADEGWFGSAQPQLACVFFQRYLDKRFSDEILHLLCMILLLVVHCWEEVG